MAKERNTAQIIARIAPADRKPLKERDMSREQRIAAWNAPQPAPTPERLAEMAREREASERASLDARKPKELAPGTKIRVLITGWAYDPNPAEVVSDNISATQDRTITAKRMRGGVREERVTVKFGNVSLWRDR